MHVNIYFYVSMTYYNLLEHDDFQRWLYFIYCANIIDETFIFAI